MIEERRQRLWPASALRARAGGLELRWIDDDLLVELAELAGRGVHDPSFMPFDFPWTRGTSAEVARNVLTYQWGVRGQAVPAGPFRIELGVVVDGVPVGIQGASGEDWRLLREVETGSWLGREFQGRGIGTRMRALMLHVLFDGLGAEHVTSGAFADNAPSNAVSRRTGYEADGHRRKVREGTAALQHRYRMTRERWEQVRANNAALLQAPVTIEGTGPLRAFLDAEES